MSIFYLLWNLCLLSMLLFFSLGLDIKINNRVARRVKAYRPNFVQVCRSCCFVALFELFLTLNNGRLFRVCSLCSCSSCPCALPLSLNDRGNPLGGWLKSARFLLGSCRQLCCFRWLFESAKKVATSYTTWSPPFLTVILQHKIKNFPKSLDFSIIL